MVGMQLPEKYKENFDFWSEGPSFGVTVTPDEGPPVTRDEGPSFEMLKFSLYFSGSCIPTNKTSSTVCLPIEHQCSLPLE